MRRFLILILILTFTWAGTVCASAKKGDTELSIYGTYMHQNYKCEDSEDNTMVAASVGHFLSDEIEIGVTGMGSWSSDISLYAIGGNAKYFFLTQSTTVPYVGGQLLYATYENGEDYDGLMYGPLGGLKFYVSEKTSLFLEYQYQLYSGDAGDYIDDAHMVLLGISFLF